MLNLCWPLLSIHWSLLLHEFRLRLAEEPVDLVPVPGSHGDGQLQVASLGNLGFVRDAGDPLQEEGRKERAKKNGKGDFFFFFSSPFLPPPPVKPSRCGEYLFVRFRIPSAKPSLRRRREGGRNGGIYCSPCSFPSSLPPSSFLSSRQSLSLQTNRRRNNGRVEGGGGKKSSIILRRLG